MCPNVLSGSEKCSWNVLKWHKHPVCKYLGDSFASTTWISGKWYYGELGKYLHFHHVATAPLMLLDECHIFIDYRTFLPFKKVTQLQPSCAQVRFNPFRDGARADKCCRIGTFPLELFVATWTWWLSVRWRQFSFALLIYLLSRTRMVVTTHKVRAEKALFPWSRLVAVEYEAELNCIYSFTVFQADSWAVIGKSRTVLMSYRPVPHSDQGMFVGQFIFNVAKETLKKLMLSWFCGASWHPRFGIAVGVLVHKRPRRISNCVDHYPPQNNDFYRNNISVFCCSSVKK